MNCWSSVTIFLSPILLKPFVAPLKHLDNVRDTPLQLDTACWKRTGILKTRMPCRNTLCFCFFFYLFEWYFLESLQKEQWGFKAPLFLHLPEGKKAYDPSTSLRVEFQLEFPGAWPGGDVASVNSIFQGIKNWESKIDDRHWGWNSSSTGG